MIEKKEHFNLLLDVYSNLLTEHQKEICQLYYEEDLSLQEIAENYKISRNAVFDIIKRVESLLEEYEEKLGLVKKEKKEQKKKVLIQIVFPLKDKEKLLSNVKVDYQLFSFEENIMVQILTNLSKVDKLVKDITSSINHYDLHILKIEKEVKK
ncbi:MAG: hypothetical protein E7184_01715 [Erysipelotrichaceae bacterium]|nr:hypothetical protein [Erysipelotrichaceae bacterium]